MDFCKKEDLKNHLDFFIIVFISDFHTHHNRCRHATGTLEDYIQAAISMDLSEIGLCDHFPMQFLPSETGMAAYSMTIEELPEYLTEAVQLKEKYREKINVKIAAEVDYYPPSFATYIENLEPYLGEFDYLIGSVHILEWEGESVWGVVDTTGPEKIKEHGLEKVMVEYFDTLIQMVQTGAFDVVGHLDLPKKYAPQRFESNHVIWNKLIELLDVIAQSEMAVEINTSGFYKGPNEQYVSDEIIKELIERNIPIQLGSDAHKPENVGFRFDEILQKLRNLGLKFLCGWTRRTKVFYNI